MYIFTLMSQDINIYMLEMNKTKFFSLLTGLYDFYYERLLQNVWTGGQTSGTESRHLLFRSSRFLSCADCFTHYLPSLHTTTWIEYRKEIFTLHSRWQSETELLAHFKATEHDGATHGSSLKAPSFLAPSDGEPDQNIKIYSANIKSACRINTGHRFEASAAFLRIHSSFDALSAMSPSVSI